MVKKNSIKLIKTRLICYYRFKKRNFVYKGAVPNLFFEEKGVIAEGKLKDKKFFIAKKNFSKTR